jgi:hypothetical protein
MLLLSGFRRQHTSNEECSNCAEETTDIVESSDSALHAFIVLNAQGLEEVLRDNNTAEYT